MPKPAATSAKPAEPGADPAPDGGGLLSQRAYAELKRRIVSLELLPGHTLSEFSMAEELGLGRAAVRVAIQRLQTERLVVVIARGGTIVAGLNASEVAQAYQVRTYLEILAARICSKRTSEYDLGELAGALKRAAAAERKRDMTVAVAATHDFFAGLRAHAQNVLLEDFAGIAAALTERFENYCALEVPDFRPPTDLHQAVLEAVRSRDAEKAESAMDAVGTSRSQLIFSLHDTTLAVRRRPGR